MAKNSCSKFVPLFSFHYTLSSPKKTFHFTFTSQIKIIEPYHYNTYINTYTLITISKTCLLLFCFLVFFMFFGFLNFFLNCFFGFYGLVKHALKFDSLRSVFQKKTSMQTCRTIKSLWAGGGWVGTTSWGQQWRGQLCGRWEPKRAGKLRDKPAGSWVWPFPPSTKQAQTPSLLHYAIGFKEIFELCMHFYIVILYHLSQLDLLVTLNAASRKHLLQSWDPVMLYLLHFIFIRKKPYSFMHESSSTIGAF